MSKKETYELLLKQIAALIEGESSNKVGVLANVAAAIHHTFDTFFWTGFYLFNEGNMLQLGPFQGTTACFNIPVGKGVCGTAFAERRALIVPNVEDFLDILLVVRFLVRKLLFLYIIRREKS